MGGKKEYQIENPTGTFYSFFVNMNNKMMLNQELIKEYDVETLSVRLKDLLRKEYRKVANTDSRKQKKGKYNQSSNKITTT